MNELFNITSVKKDALKNYDMIEEKINQSKHVLEGFSVPDVSIGEHCFSPYSCDFMNTCWKNVPKNSVFEISGIPKSEQFKLFHEGYTTIKKIPKNNSLDQNANIHIQAVKSGEIRVDTEAINNFITKVKYPVLFMDFETFMPAVPIFNNTKPYQHIPFQYSIHRKNQPDSELLHSEFLAEQGVDPRKFFIENLLKDTDNEGTILVYDAQMERNVFNGLKTDFPEYAEAIELRLKRIVDLAKPFQERSYYHPLMKNSFSIKNLVPALAPDLSYLNLKISSGSIAMIAFAKLQTETDMFKILDTREQLLEYCKLDTLAMVRVFEVLVKAVTNKLN